MSNSREMRRLQAKWLQNTGWPQRLEWIEIDGIRGWAGQRIPFDFPIMAIVGENGSGKSTVLQCAASIYQPQTPSGHDEQSKLRYASDFFPKTLWEDIQKGEIRYSIRQGIQTPSRTGKVNKPSHRWRGNLERPTRGVSYIDLRRLLPISARSGYAKLAKDARMETGSVLFDQRRLARFNQIMNSPFDSARMVSTDMGEDKLVPVFSGGGAQYSGFHAGAGQTTLADFLRLDPNQYGLVLIDEIETSLHPRAQRRFIRDLAELCRDRELQIVVTTHSPYVLAELPLEARLYLMQGQSGRHVVGGVSPEFAMTRMDEYPHPECELFVEDDRAVTFLREIIVGHSRGLIERCAILPYGASNVGRSLGMMVSQDRFPRPTKVFLDGDQADAPGCALLPGGDAPEIVVFTDLQKSNWGRLAERTGRQFAEVADACMRVQSLSNHHDWVNSAATVLQLSGETLWQAMCAEWATNCLQKAEGEAIIQGIQDLFLATPGTVSSPIVRMPLFEQSRDAFQDQGELTLPSRP